MLLTKKIYNRLTSLATNYGFRSEVRQIEYFTSRKKTERNLLIVGPGNITIPPSGWGAVELIISETIPYLLEAGFNITLLNSTHRKDWKSVQKQSYSAILNHHDVLSARIKNCWKSTPLVTVSHYGLAGQVSKWHHSFTKTIKSMQAADAIICLSENIRSTFSNYFEKSKLFTYPNGSSFDVESLQPSNGKFLYLGKVEARKKQFEFAKIAKKNGFLVNFAGPIVDSRVELGIFTGDFNRDDFLGPIERVLLKSFISEYLALILLSEGEADALVLYEAQIAGLPIIVNSASLGSQDPKLPWIFVVDEFEDIGIIREQIVKERAKGHQISEYALRNYGWETRITNVVNLINKLAAK